MKKNATIAVVGVPNVGKSSLTNLLLGQKISIVSPKVQTTRNSIKAIITEGNSQLVLIDTPGIFIPRQDKILERIIVKSAWQALREADHICLVVDSSFGLDVKTKNVLSDLKKEGLDLTIIINKIDLVKKSAILQIIADFANEGFVDILPISTVTNYGIDALKKLLFSKAIHDGWLYDHEQITDAPMRFIASEITREKLFLKLNQEIPYSLTVKTETYEVFDNSDIKIHQTIYVTKSSHKTIILGKHGNMIKEISITAKEDISKIVGAKIHLFLFIKVQKDWMNKTDSYEKIDINKLPS